MSEDPFDRPDAGPDRDGDPVESLDGETLTDGDDAETTSASADGDGEPSVPDAGTRGGADAATSGEPDPFEYSEDRPVDGSREQDAEDWPDGESADTVDVVADAFGDVDVSRGDPFEEPGSAFERVDVDSVDPDAVWDRFTGSAERTGDPSTVTLGGETVPEDAVTVPKGRFCQTCPHFTSPPDTSCTHEGTEILRFVGTDGVRVENCPVVGERRELGETFE